MEKTTKRWRATYEQPLIELCAAEPYKFLAASPYGLGGDAGEGGNGGVINGAKKVDILGTEFSFSDVWEEEL